MGHEIRQGLYTIPSGTRFLNRLAEGLLEMSNGDEMALTRMRVLLPTRRAGRELRDAFLSLSHGKPLLLPRLQPIGDVDAEEIDLYFSGFGNVGHDIPPAISALERQFLLAPLVQKKDPSLCLDAALSLSGELARLIDTVHTEDLDFSGLQNIVPNNLAIHWQKTLQFLEIITDFWPKILKERGQIDSADRRNRLLKSLAALWREHPPETPIIAAGSTGSIPSAGELLKVISELPQGVVILPGLDKDLDEESWGHITDTHPQATMRNLLNRMGKTRADVHVWPEAAAHQTIRADFVRTIMRPAETFGQMNEQNFTKGLEGLHIIEAATPREEAAVIALALRETLETPDKTACFITPDRTLARRVMTALQRWGIEVDDSAGGALATTSSSTFLLSLIRMIEQKFAPLELLDFLKHDLQRLITDDDITYFERYALRGARPAEGIAGLHRRVMRAPQHQESLQPVVTILETHFAHILKLTTGTYSLETYCEAVIQASEIFAGGAENFWGRNESNAVSSFLTNVMGYADLLPDMDFHTFAGVFRELLMAENFRPDNEPHRRILILGQLESRLIRRDVMILGGLNEGTWPREPSHDPWMSRPMREAFGLPPADRGTGLAAHDFAEHVSAAEVFITRSLKEGGAATVPARWIQKLRTLLQAQGVDTNWSKDNHYLEWAQQIDRPFSFTPLYATPPEPRPPLADRPQILSATWIEKWMKNPYRVYAEKILRLRLLDPIDKDTLHAERGSFVHDVLLAFVQQYPHQMPENARGIILAIGEEKLATLEHVATHWHYWWPRFERLVDWFINEETKWRQEALPWIQEETGQYEIYRSEATGRHFTVTAKADRIDRLKAGGAAILDYKTGTPPSTYKIKNGAAPQLPIESFILNEGGYRNTSTKPELMVYWKLSGSHSKAGEVKKIKDNRKDLDMEQVIDATRNGLTNLVSLFENPDTAYQARIVSGRLYDDERAYAHLARMSEWSSGEAENDDGSDEAAP